MRRYSDRLPWSAPVNKLSELRRRKVNAGIAIADLTETNPTAAGFDYPHLAIANALAAPCDFSYQPDPFGLLGAREAVADYYRERNLPVSTSRLALTASTSEAYSLLFKLLCDAGDEILIPAPSYPLFEHLAALENVRTVPYRLEYEGAWYIDFDYLKHQLSPRTRAVATVNPNNPTGSFLKHEEKRRLVELAAERQLALISDEVFFDYELRSSSGRVKTLVEENAVLSFSLNGLSKAAGMPQVKLAWIVINGPEDEQEQARKRLELLLDTYLSVNTPVQLALRGLFAAGADLRAAILARCQDNYNLCCRVLAGSPVHVLAIEGGWSVILQLPRTESEEQWMMDLLSEQNVLLQPGFFFDMPGEAFAVASLIVEPTVFGMGISRLRQFVVDRCG